MQGIKNKEKEKVRKVFSLMTWAKILRDRSFLLSGNSTAPILHNGVVTSATDVCDFTLQRAETVRTPNKCSVCHSFKPCLSCCFLTLQFCSHPTFTRLCETRGS